MTQLRASCTARDFEQEVTEFTEDGAAEAIMMMIPEGHNRQRIFGQDDRVKTGMMETAGI